MGSKVSKGISKHMPPRANTNRVFFFSVPGAVFGCHKFLQSIKFLPTISWGRKCVLSRVSRCQDDEQGVLVTGPSRCCMGQVGRVDGGTNFESEISLLPGVQAHICVWLMVILISAMLFKRKLKRRKNVHC